MDLKKLETARKLQDRITSIDSVASNINTRDRSVLPFLRIFGHYELLELLETKKAELQKQIEDL